MVHQARLLVVVSLCAADAALANPAKAWNAARASLPADTAVVVGIDLPKLAKSKLYTTALPLLLSQDAEVKEGLDQIKTVCGLDPFKVIQGIVVGADKDNGSGAVFLSLAGVDETRVVECLDSIAKAEGGKDAKVVVTKDGAISQWAVGTEKLYVRWIGKDVLALALDPEDKAQLAKWAAPKGAFAKSAAAKSVAKTDTKAAVWGVAAKERDIDGVAIKRGYGWIHTGGGNLAVSFRAVAPSAADAATMAAKINTDLAAKAPSLPANLQKLLAGVAVKANAEEVHVDAKIVEADAIAAAGALMMMK